MHSFIIKPNSTLLFSHTKFVSLINYYSENDEANTTMFVHPVST